MDALGHCLPVLRRRISWWGFIPPASCRSLSPRLVLKLDSLQAILDQVVQNEARAKKVKPQELVDMRYKEEMNKSGFFDQFMG